MDAMPTIGYVDLGSVIYNTTAWRQAGLNFTQFNGACNKDSCHDGALVKYVVESLNWKWKQHPPGVCAFLHNPNPESCHIVGGFYWDTNTIIVVFRI